MKASDFQQTVNFEEYSDTELVGLVAEGQQACDPRVEKAFGIKTALCLVSTNWQNKEQAMKHILRATEKYMTRSEITA